MSLMNFGNTDRELVREKQWKTCELHESLCVDYADIEQLDRDTYLNKLDGKKYSVTVVKKKFVIRELV